MAKVQVELDTYDMETILRGLDQVFLRYEEVCKRVLTEVHDPRMYIEENIAAMKRFQKTAATIGEELKKLPWMDHTTIDDFVSMGGNWENRLNKIQDKLDEKLANKDKP